MQPIRISHLMPGITRHNDLLLAFLLVPIISLIILPLPTGIMDTLIAANLGLSIILLMLSLYIP